MRPKADGLFPLTYYSLFTRFLRWMSQNFILICAGLCVSTWEIQGTLAVLIIISPSWMVFACSLSLYHCMMITRKPALHRTHRQGIFFEIWLLWDTVQWVKHLEKCIDLLLIQHILHVFCLLNISQYGQCKLICISSKCIYILCTFEGYYSSYRGYKCVQIIITCILHLRNTINKSWLQVF